MQVQRVKVEKGGGQRTRLPITPLLLKWLKGVWQTSVANHVTKYYISGLLYGFFGFLREGEMTVPDNRPFNQSVHMGLKCTTPSSPSFVRVTIKQSKTDPSVFSRIKKGGIEHHEAV